MFRKTKIAWHVAGIRAAIAQTFKQGRQPTVPEFTAFNARYETLLRKLSELGMPDDELECELEHMLKRELGISLEEFVTVASSLTLEAARQGVIIQ